MEVSKILSFQSRHVVNPNKKVANSTANDIAETINSAYREAGEKLHVQGLKPLRPVTGKTLYNNNPDCFTPYNKKITETGRRGFDAVNESLGVSSESTMKEYSKAMTDYITKYYDKGMDGNVCHLFDVLV